jgi:uncharacterized damage-inducible protein DinB
MKTLFAQLLEYTVWANDTVLSLFEKYGASVPSSSLRLMSHIANAQSTWLVRITGVAPVVGIWEEYDLAGCRRLNSETLEGLRRVLDEPGFDPGRKVEYKNSAGTAFENTLGDLLLQLFTHGGYHRGQIAMQLREQGLEPVNTDYIMYIRLSPGQAFSG